MRASWKKVVARGVAVMLTATLAVPTDALACTQIYMGRETTTTGETFVGRSEDFATRHAKAFGIQEPMENPTYKSGEEGSDWGGFNYTYKGTTLRYTYVRDTAAEWDGCDDSDRSYSEAGINEKGVSVSATLTTGCNDKIEETDPGIPAGIGEYSVTDVVLGQATSARDGVERLGKIIDEHGNYDYNQILISDNTETWIFMQLSGHEWMAMKAPSDKVSLNPNMGRLQFSANLDDPNQVVHSAGIVETAKKAGTWDESWDMTTANIAKAYGEEESGAGQNTRYAQGHAYFGDVLEEGKDYTVNEKGQVATIADPQLFFTPANKIDLYTAIRSYAARGEQVSSLNANLNTDLYSIGNPRTVETHMFEIDHSLPADIATVQWEALSRSEFSVAIPVYSALLTKVPTDLYPTSTEMDTAHQGENQRVDSVEAAMQDDPKGYLDYVMMDINTLAYNNRQVAAPGVAAYLKAIQQELISQQAEVAAAMKAADPAQRTEMANTYFERASREVYTKCDKMLDELRAYLKKGDFSEQFMPSDLVQETKLAEPVYYAEEAPESEPEPVKLSITAQPTSIEVAQGEKAELSVIATAGEAKLSYQWYKKDPAAPSAKTAARRDATGMDGFVPIEGATDSTYSADTTNAGSTDYLVVVSTDNGQELKSDVATVKVKAIEKVDQSKANTPKKTTHRGTTPQTGDATSVAIPAGLAACAALAFGISYKLRRKYNQR